MLALLVSTAWGASAGAPSCFGIHSGSRHVAASFGDSWVWIESFLSLLTSVCPSGIPVRAPFLSLFLWCLDHCHPQVPRFVLHAVLGVRFRVALYFLLLLLFHLVDLAVVFCIAIAV